MKQESILGRARREAVREYASQSSMVEYDSGYIAGERDERCRSEISNRRWFRFGVLCGIAISVLVWSFWP